MAKSILPGPERFLRLDEGSGGRVGQGSFGQIYMAVDQVTQQLVAVKRQSLPKEQAARELARLQPRLPTLVQLKHFTPVPASVKTANKK